MTVVLHELLQFAMVQIQSVVAYLNFVLLFVIQK